MILPKLSFIARVVYIEKKCGPNIESESRYSIKFAIFTSTDAIKSKSYRFLENYNDNQADK